MLLHYIDVPHSLPVLLTSQVPSYSDAMQHSVPFSLSRRSPPRVPLSAFQLNPPPQRWQLATDDGGLDVLGRTEQATLPAPTEDDDDAAIDLRAELPMPLAELSSPPVDYADASIAATDEDASAAPAASKVPVPPSKSLHDSLTCCICGPGRRREQRMHDEARSSKEEAADWTAEAEQSQAAGRAAAADEAEVSLLQMNDLLFLIWDYLPLSQVLHFQHICPHWKELLRLRPGSEDDEQRAAAYEQRQQEERDEAGDSETVRRIQRELHHIRDHFEHGMRAERPPAIPAAAPPQHPSALPLGRMPPLLADFDTLFGRQLAFYRAVTGRGAAREDMWDDDMAMRDEMRRMNAEDIAAIASELEEMDDTEDDAVAVADVNRHGRVRQRERRLERQHAKRARLTPALVRALWERAHDRPNVDASGSVSLASTATASSLSSPHESPSLHLRSSSDATLAMDGSIDGTREVMDEPMLDDELPDDSPVLHRPAHSASSQSSASPLSSASSFTAASSTSSVSSSPLSSFSCLSASSSSSSSSPSVVDAPSLTGWSSRSYLRRLTHAKLSLSPFINPSLSPAVVATLSSLTSVHLYHFPFVRTVFDAEYEALEAEAEEVRQLKGDKEAGEKEERRIALAQQKQEKQALSKQLPDDAVKAVMREMDRRRREGGQLGDMDLVWARRAVEADDRLDMREARDARDARDGRRTPPARLVAALMRQARLLTTHRPPRCEAPQLQLLKPLAPQLTSVLYSPACWTTRDMEQLQALTSLTSLSIHCQMSESAMRGSDQIAPFLSSFPALQSLSLCCNDDGATFPANVVQHLTLLQPTLTSLAIHSSHWKAEHLATIATLTNLRSLTLSFTTTPVTQAHFTSFAALSQLTSLTLHCGTHLSYPLPPPLFALSSLTSLAVFGSVNVHQSALQLLSQLTELTRLRLSGCFDSLNGLVPCVIACTQLRVFDVRGSAMSWRYREMLRCERPDIRVLESCTDTSGSAERTSIVRSCRH